MEIKINYPENNSRRKILISITIVVILIILLMVISTIFALINVSNSKMMKGVYIENVDVSNLSVEEATKKVNDYIYQVLNSDMNLKYNTNDNIIKVHEIKAKFDTENALVEAYNIGRNKNIVQNNYEILGAMLFKKKINLNYTTSTEETDKILDNIESKIENVVVQNAYYIDGEELVITKGKPGIKINKEDTKENIDKFIKNKLSENQNDSVKIITKKAEPDKLDIEKIHTEIYKEPKDAYYTENPFKVYPEVDGIDFNLSIEEINNLLQEDKEEYRIPLKISKPNVTIEQISTSVFPHLLSTFTTNYDASVKGRATNVTLATNAINEKVLLPGETFSFNTIVGNTTKEKGYQLATSYMNGKTVQDYGGGICQVSTTLYNAALRANLEIVERRNHGHIVSYVDLSTDATIAYPTTDFKFKNNRNYAIKIIAVAKNGVLKMEIYGIKEETEYEVVIESQILQVIPFETKNIENNKLPEGTQNVLSKGVNGYKSIAYKILKLNGLEVSRSVLSEDTYVPMTREIEIGTKKASSTVQTSAPSEETNTVQTNETSNETNLVNQTAPQNIVTNLDGVTVTVN